MSSGRGLALATPEIGLASPSATTLSQSMIGHLPSERQDLSLSQLFPFVFTLLLLLLETQCLLEDLRIKNEALLYICMVPLCCVMICRTIYLLKLLNTLTANI